ncbi:MAG: endonuclease V [Candidatus Omnitrophica bacterium]|nr:endonuclease V [Candidatus Omnitrophota bacterium]
MQLKSHHSWTVSPQQAIRLQEKLRIKIRLKKLNALPKFIAAADVAFKQKMAYGAVAVFSYPDLCLIETIQKTATITFPYIPGLLTFREGPVLEKCFRALQSDPQVIIFDGQGIAHPRNMGIATHFGILLNKATIGCAKSWLFGTYTEPPRRQGTFSLLIDSNKRKIGAVLRTKDNVKPAFVSVGNRIDLESSIKIILECCRGFRIPEPLRVVHQMTLQEK